MGTNWIALKQEIDAENTRILDTSPEDILRVYQYDIARNGAATGGLMLGLWMEGATASRYIGAYYVYNIIKLAMDPAFDLADIQEMTALLLPKVVETAELCGMETYGRFSREVLRTVPEIDDMPSLLELLNAFYLYGSNMNAWIHHYMKWGVAYAFPIPRKAQLLDVGRRADESYR